MKTLITILILASTSHHALAEADRLLLIAAETAIRPGANISLDVYLYNSASRPKKVPSLDLASASYLLDDVTGARSGRAGGTTEISTEPPAEHVLQPNGIERRRITLKIPAEPGDMVTIYVTLGRTTRLRSNSVLLYCPATGGKHH